MKFKDVFNAISLEQSIKVVMNEEVRYSGELQDMQAGPLLTMQDYEVKRLQAEGFLLIELEGIYM